MRKTARNLKFFCMVILMTILPLTAWNPVLAQNHAEDDWKNSKITLRISNESLGHILKIVAEKAKAPLVLQ